MKTYSFDVEDIYTGDKRSGTVSFDDATVADIVRFLREVDGESSIYTSSLEEYLPDVYNAINDAALPLMEEMDAGRQGGFYRVNLPVEILAMAGDDILRMNTL